MDYWKRLLVLPEATPQDRQDAARLALQLRQLEFAEEQIQPLLAANPETPEILELAAELAIQKGDRDTALAFAGRLLARNPQHHSAPLLQAQLLFSSPVAQQQQQGKRQLQNLAKGTDAPALNALRALTGGTLSAEERASLASALAAHPAARIDDQLTAVSIRIAPEPAAKERLIDAAVQRFASADGEALTSLGRWTNQHGEALRTLGIISEERAGTHADLFLVRLDALASLGKWAEIQASLAREPNPLSPTHREVFLARAAQELGEVATAEVHWRRALLAAGQNPQLILYVAQYATKIGTPKIVEKAYRQLAANPAWTLRATSALVPIVESHGDSRALRDLLRQLTRLAPAEAAPRNDAAYLDLLLNEDVSAARTTAEALVRKHPEMLAYRTTLALAHLRSDEPQKARELFSGIRVNWEQCPPGWRAVHAATLAASGELQEAEAIALALPRDKLKAEERELLEALLGEEKATPSFR
jgi:hypothetical protein